MKLVIIDNYDSFTYNLYHYLNPMVDKLEVVRNNPANIEFIREFDGVVYSPGPGLPEESAIMFKILTRYEKEKPILGICLGHQAIIEHYGGKLTNLQQPLHGLTVKVNQTKNKDEIFEGISFEFDTGRYHSWACHMNDLPGVLTATAIDESNMVMALRHNKYNIKSMQYHPESVMTPQGKQMLQNWVQSVDLGIH